MGQVHVWYKLSDNNFFFFAVSSMFMEKPVDSTVIPFIKIDNKTFKFNQPWRIQPQQQASQLTV